MLQTGAAGCRTGGDSDLLQHARGAEDEWLAGLPSGELPPPVGMRGLVSVLADLREMVTDDRGDLGREVKGLTTETQHGLAGGGSHAVPGQADDPGEWLVWPKPLISRVRVFSPDATRSVLLLTAPIRGRRMLPRWSDDHVTRLAAGRTA